VYSVVSKVQVSDPIFT